MRAIKEKRMKIRTRQLKEMKMKRMHVHGQERVKQPIIRMIMLIIYACSNITIAIKILIYTYEGVEDGIYVLSKRTV